MSKLKEIRQKKGLSREELAVKAKITARYVWALEAGDRKPSIDLAFKISKILGTKIEDIFLPSICTKCSEQKEQSKR